MAQVTCTVVWPWTVCAQTNTQCQPVSNLSVTIITFCSTAGGRSSCWHGDFFARATMFCWQCFVGWQWRGCASASKAWFPFNPKGRFKLSPNTLKAVFSLSAEMLEFSPTLRKKNKISSNLTTSGLGLDFFPTLIRKCNRQVENC